MQIVQPLSFLRFSSRISTSMKQDCPLIKKGAYYLIFVFSVIVSAR